VPAPDATKVLIRTQAQALIRVLGKRRGERFLREWAAVLDDLDSVQSLFPVNPAKDRAAISEAQTEALIWFRQIAPILWGSIPRD
jgi:hypothetical protein